jgi:hypothetical protein
MCVFSYGVASAQNNATPACTPSYTFGSTSCSYSMNFVPWGLMTWAGVLSAMAFLLQGRFITLVPDAVHALAVADQQAPDSSAAIVQIQTADLKLDGQEPAGCLEPVAVPAQAHFANHMALGVADHKVSPYPASLDGQA